MENSNCTFYMEGVPMRAKLDIWHGSNHIWYESDSDLDKGDGTFAVTIAAPPNDNGKTVMVYPNVPSYLLDIDKDCKTILETVYDYTEVVPHRIWYKPWTWLLHPQEICKYKTIYHDISGWEWRNPDAKCLCGSINYRAMGHGLYRCNDCDKVFSTEKQEAQ